MFKRQCERLTETLQKVKYDTEFLRYYLIYNLTPNFVRIRILKPDLMKLEQH